MLNYARVGSAFWETAWKWCDEGTEQQQQQQQQQFYGHFNIVLK